MASRPILEMKVNQRDLQNLYKWLGKFEEVAKKPEVMDKAVKHIGKSIDKQFRSEGTGEMGGKWAPLSKMTQELRQSRGYNPRHPILQQSGALRDVAAGTLLAWNVGTGRAITSGENIRMTAWTGQLAFTAKISGAKVQNQYGGPTEFSFYPERPGQGGRRSDLPARPFFGLTPASVMYARREITDKVLIDWAKRSRTAKRV